MSNIMEIRNISKKFIIKQSPFVKPRTINALNHINLDIEEGAIYGIIGESGSGKSTLGKIVANLLSADEGAVYLDDINISKIKKSEQKTFRKDIQIVFQMALNPLDPKRNVEELLYEPLKIHLKLSHRDIIKNIDNLLSSVGLSSEFCSKLPFQMSGGQRQRVIIARAIATKPRLIVLDEPVSALDVSMQGQIMNLLIDLRKELGLTYLFITHDLYLARKFCTHVAVMKDGFVIESGKTRDIMTHPKEEYTKKLIQSFD